MIDAPVASHANGTEENSMTIAFEIPHDIEQQIRISGADLNGDAKEVYLMEQYRQAKITHRQLEDALNLSFHETELLLKQRGLGQDPDTEAFESGGELLSIRGGRDLVPGGTVVIDDANITGNHETSSNDDVIVTFTT
jgi:hypothetical protein